MAMATAVMVTAAMATAAMEAASTTATAMAMATDPLQMLEYLIFNVYAVYCFLVLFCKPYNVKSVQQFAV